MAALSEAIQGVGTGYLGEDLVRGRLQGKGAIASVGRGAWGTGIESVICVCSQVREGVEKGNFGADDARVMHAAS